MRINYYSLLFNPTYTSSGTLSWAMHFWVNQRFNQISYDLLNFSISLLQLGAESSIDEGGIAAYKTVELDEHLGGSARQYREV